MNQKQKYIIISGEGEGEGTVVKTRRMTEIGIKRRLTKERCDGDRWARAYEKLTSDAAPVYLDIETGEARSISVIDIFE